MDNPRWHELVEELLRLKGLGARICGNRRVLQSIYRFSRFECYPTTRPVIYPNGDLFHSCAPPNSIAGHLLEIGDYDSTVERGRKAYGLIPYCDSRCHVDCYMEPSTLTEHPGDAVIEVMRYLLPQKKKVEARRPRRLKKRAIPPPSCNLRRLPSLPPDTIRSLRKEGRLANDFTSLVWIKPTIGNATAFDEKITP